MLTPMEKGFKITRVLKLVGGAIGLRAGPVKRVPPGGMNTRAEALAKQYLRSATPDEGVRGSTR